MTKRLLKKLYISSIKHLKWKARKAKRKPSKRLKFVGSRVFRRIPIRKFYPYLSKGVEVRTSYSFPVQNGMSFFLRHVIIAGSKKVRFKQIIGCFFLIKFLLKTSIEQFFHFLFRRITPLIKFIPKTYGRTVMKIPVKAPVLHSMELSAHQIMRNSLNRDEETFELRLFNECFDSLKLRSNTIKWKQKIHTEAFENKANTNQLRYL